MNVEQIRKRVHEDPTPFVVRLTDGRKFPIPHRDYIAIGKHLVIVIAAGDSSVKIDPLHIVSLDDAKAKKEKVSLSSPADSLIDGSRWLKIH